MSGDDISIIPISDEQARLGQEAIKAISGFGSFLKDALGSIPSDFIGYFGGDWLRARRAENMAKLMRKTEERLKEWGAKNSEPASLSVALPILQCAADESREELQDLWARLLAAAIDPSRVRFVRQKFTEVISSMDPIDALVLANYESFSSEKPDAVIANLGISRDQYIISLDNLSNLKIVEAQRFERLLLVLSSFGREFIRVIMK